MTRSSILVTAESPSGLLYAWVDPAARYVTPEVSQSRLGAQLAPFADVDTARTALVEAGGKILGGDA